MIIGYSPVEGKALVFVAEGGKGWVCLIDVPISGGFKGEVSWAMALLHSRVILLLPLVWLSGMLCMAKVGGKNLTSAFSCRLMDCIL
jgi:hypothetical protein